MPKTCYMLTSVQNRTSNTMYKSKYRIPQGLMCFRLIDLLLIKDENTKTFVV